jgi:hypothetical protein
MNNESLYKLSSLVKKPLCIPKVIILQPNIPTYFENIYIKNIRGFIIDIKNIDKIIELNFSYKYAIKIAIKNDVKFNKFIEFNLPLQYLIKLNNKDTNFIEFPHNFFFGNIDIFDSILLSADFPIKMVVDIMYKKQESLWAL